VENNVKSKKLTEKQQLVFDYIREFTQKFGYPPTIREIGEKFTITVKGAYDHIKAI
jgi:repressor LexA